MSWSCPTHSDVNHWQERCDDVWMCSSESSGFSLGFEESKDVSLSNWTLHVSNNSSVVVVQELALDLSNTTSGSYIIITTVSYFCSPWHEQRILQTQPPQEQDPSTKTCPNNTTWASRYSKTHISIARIKCSTNEQILWVAPYIKMPHQKNDTYRSFRWSVALQQKRVLRPLFVDRLF